MTARNRIAGITAWALLGLSRLCPGSDIGVLLDGVKVSPQHLVINRSDTVTWRTSLGQEDNVVESYLGEWQSPRLLDPGASYSHAFTEPGTNVYRSRYRPAAVPPLYWDSPGLIIVLDSREGAPPVRINSPIEGFHFALREDIPILATPTNSPANVGRVEFHVDDRLHGEVTNVPYTMLLTNLTAGAHSLTAKVVGIDGAQLGSPVVNITVVDTPAPLLLSPRMMSGGLFAFDYVGWWPFTYAISSSSDFRAWGWLSIAGVTRSGASGTYVEAIAADRPQRFIRFEKRF